MVVTDKKLFWSSLTVISITLILFVIYEKLNLTLEFVAILGAVLILLISGVDPEMFLRILNGIQYFSSSDSLFSWAL